MDERSAYRSLSLQRARQAVGETLRQCREGFGESLEQMAVRTRVQERYLRALEEGDYSAFPGEIWARLFLRGYAQDLGLDVDALMEQAFGPAAPSPSGARGGSTPAAGGAGAGTGKDATAIPEPESEPAPVPEGRRARRRARRGTSGGQGTRASAAGRSAPTPGASPPSGERVAGGARRRARRRRARLEVRDEALLPSAPIPEGGEDDTAAPPMSAQRRTPAVGSDLDEELRVVLGEDGADAAGTLAEEGADDQARQVGAVRRGPWVTPAMAVAASLAVAALLTWLVVRLVTVPGGTGGVAAGPRGSAGPVERPPGVQVPAVTTVRDQGGRATYAVRASSVDLTLVFDGPCWVGLFATSGNGYVLSRTYEAGEMLHLTRAPGFTLELGAGWRAHGVLNGTPIGPWRGGNVWYVSVVGHAAAHA